MNRPTAFKKGKSGNPKGRPRIVSDVRELARQHTDAAIAVLESIMADETEDARARVAAANAILDRGHGKPQQHIDVATTSPIAVQIITPLTKDLSK